MFMRWYAGHFETAAAARELGASAILQYSVSVGTVEKSAACRWLPVPSYLFIPIERIPIEQPSRRRLKQLHKKLCTHF